MALLGRNDSLTTELSWVCLSGRGAHIYSLKTTMKTARHLGKMLPSVSFFRQIITTWQLLHSTRTHTWKQYSTCTMSRHSAASLHQASARAAPRQYCGMIAPSNLTGRKKLHFIFATSTNDRDVPICVMKMLFLVTYFTTFTVTFVRVVCTWMVLSIASLPKLHHCPS